MTTPPNKPVLYTVDVILPARDARQPYRPKTIADESIAIDKATCFIYLLHIIFKFMIKTCAFRNSKNHGVRIFF